MTHVRTRRAVGIAAGAITVALIAGCAGTSSPPSDSTSHTLTIGSAGAVNSYDSAQAQEGMILPFQTVYDTLLRRDPSGELHPMLATAWEYNEDNTVLTLDLQEGVTFSDGEVFDAEAAKANLEHFQTANGPQGFTLAGVTAIDVVDEDTITLALAAPDPALLTYLSNAAGMMGSPAAIGTEEMKTVPVGSGPYVLDTERTIPGSELHFTAREGYWSPDLQKFDEVVVKFMPDMTAQFNALVSGQIDATLLDAKTAKQADAQGLTGYSQTMDWRGLFIADRDGEVVPALADPRVRQAINYALDGESMLSSIEQGRGEITSQIFGTATTAYDKELDSAYGNDVARAKELMAEAGYADGFAIDMPAIEGFDPALWPVLQQALAEIGVTVTMVPVAGADVITELTSRKFPVFYMSLFQPDTWIAVSQQVAPTALFNPFQTQRDEVDAWLSQIQLSATPEEQEVPAQALNEYLVEEAWFAPLYRPDSIVYGNDKVTIEPQTQQLFPSIYNFTPAN